MLLKEYAHFKGRFLRSAGLEPAVNLKPRENGEYALLSYLRRLPEMGKYNCIIDVGANLGDWTDEAARVFAGSNITRIESVEPVPVLAEGIRARFTGRNDIVVRETALGAEKSTADIFFNGSGGGMYRTYRGGSVAPKDHKKESILVKVPVARGDDLYSAPDIKPYLLKIDCDGHDWHVLRGFGTVLREKRPVVQFEYCDFWIGGKSRLRTASRYLYDLGYVTYKLFPDRLVPFRFNPLFETFSYQNIVAVPKEFSSLASHKILRFI